jgi:exopolysaccharide biosynthesis polyprenyl glycosylphosphotransferase
LVYIFYAKDAILISDGMVLMRTPDIHVSPTPAPASWQPACRAKVRFRFTVLDRKWLLILVDLLLANACLLAALVMWSTFVPSLPTLWDNLKWFITLSTITVGCNVLFDNYNLARAGSVTSIMISMVSATVLAGLVFVSIPWLTPALSTRSYLFGFLSLFIGTAVVWRIFYAKAFYQPSFSRRVLVVGTGRTATTLVKELDVAHASDHANPFRGTGYQVVGLVSVGGNAQPEANDEVRILGTIDQLSRLARIYRADEIIVALDAEELNAPTTYEALLDCRELGTHLSPLDAVYERLTARLPVNYAERDPRVLLGPADSPANRLYYFAKRLLDIVLALAGMLPLGLVAVCVALANAIWSPGPLLYRQQRLGQGGRSFALLKFRSMITDAEKTTGAVWCGDRDSRITPVGRFLRRTRLDEMPQFLNVLWGEMSMVGPRPERPYFVGQLTQHLPLYRARHAVKPGITGWAQIRYRYGNSIEDSRIKLEYDLYYIKHASLYVDLIILLQTIPAMIQFKGK